MTLLDTANLWLEAGTAVVPTATDGTKRPGLPQWKQFQTERPTPTDLETWFTPGRTDGIGLICGQVSGNLEMVEFEGRATHLIPELAELMADNGFADLWTRLTANGYVETTPSGGIHIYYRVDGDAAPNTKLASKPRDGGGVDVLIETRGEGGFTVIAPSAGRTHPTGLAWTTITGTPQSVPTISIDDRDALFALASTLDKMPEQALPATPAAAHNPADGLRPGDDFDARTTWDEVLTPAGWTKTKRIGAGFGWTRPGKNAGDGISATTGQNEHDRLYVFTTSTELPTENPLSKFAAYAILHYAGDYTAAAKQLAKDGYGTIATRLAPDNPTAEDLNQLVAPTESTPTWNNQPPSSTAPATETSTATTTGPTAPAPAATSASAAEPNEPTTPPARDAEPNEDNTALLLVDQHQYEIRYCQGRGGWLTWNGHRWTEDDRGHIRQLVRTIARRLPKGEGWDTYRKRALSANGVKGIIDLAASDPRIVAHIADLDARPYELNTPAGVVNLRTGTINKPDPAALHTRSTTVAPNFNQPAPMWNKFLADTFAGDPTMTAYVQRLLGLSLVGVVLEQIFPFAHGAGANGKTTLFSVAQHLAGMGPTGYAMSAPATMLLATKNDAHPTELARLSGARMVVTSELEDNQRFAEAKIKLLTGKDTISGRFMRQDWFDFTPTHTLWLLANYQPEVRAGGDAFWRRVRLLPFLHTVPPEQRVPDLEDKLIDQEGPAILAWMIQGAADYFTQGLAEPTSVTRATAAYQRDQDSLARFVDECCELGPLSDPNMSVPSHELRRAYERWCTAEGEEPRNQRSMTTSLKTRFDVITSRTSTLRILKGIRLAGSVTDASPEASSQGFLDGTDRSDRGGW
ncbi:phage/plasmid primase, P4 family [Demequina flava]|uniref:phage/plasmid primase, P4 family n=1 Tax=Demequina flava TaxID=1095025 RepID=UPI0007817FD3|nr:phage/plasmid primase, P4 family [Demequina flava]